jgi:hypothetical protein
VADAVIAGVILLAMYWGLRRGLIGPLVLEVGFIFAFVIASTYHSKFASFVPSVVPQWATTIVIVVAITFGLALLLRIPVGIIRRLPMISPMDRTAGLIVHGIVAFALLYLAIGAILDFDRQIYPFLIAGRATAQQVQAYRDAVNGNPVIRALVNQQAIDSAQSQANDGPLPLAKFQETERFLDFYIKFVREPMAISRLAPVVNSIGGNVPVIGHARPYLQGTTSNP